jgi:archaellum biogenesis ATPase FlaH
MVHAAQSDALVQTEKALLGSVLLTNSLWSQTSGLMVEDLYLDSHRRIYARMAAMFEDQRPVDLVTVTGELAQLHQLESCGGAAYVASLIEHALPENIAAYVRSVRNAAIERRTARQIELLTITCAGQSPEKMSDLREQVQQLLDSLDAAASSDSSVRKTGDVSDILALEIPDMDYIIDDILPRGNVVLLTGSPGCGKSFLALKMAVEIAREREFLGRRCEATRVLILDKENPVQLQRQRLRTLAGGSILYPELKIWGGWLKDPPAMLGDPRLLKWAKEEKLLMIFDSLVRFHEADENDASEMRHVMAHIRRLADAGATVVLLHHKPKSDELLYRGSSDILAAVDMAFILEVVCTGSLRLRCFKSRLSEERTFTIAADFARGRFELTDSAVAVLSRNEVAILGEIIAEFPGCTQNEIVEKSGLRRQRVIDLLHKYADSRWRSESGPRRAKLYFPLIPCTVSDLIAENSPGTSPVNGSVIDSHCQEPVGTGPLVSSIPTPMGWDTEPDERKGISNA